ncbi:hypothetical protein LY76DRAFT_55164 [Colletotrichum caudatum]|nr:hypothetical protein LY76DRAFT_55164 [Colletotrichum caudatum]
MPALAYLNSPPASAVESCKQINQVICKGTRNLCKGLGFFDCSGFARYSLPTQARPVSLCCPCLSSPLFRCRLHHVRSAPWWPIAGNTCAIASTNLLLCAIPKCLQKRPQGCLHTEPTLARYLLGEGNREDADTSRFPLSTSIRSMSASNRNLPCPRRNGLSPWLIRPAFRFGT